jgi:intraflagellar transport protein 52
LKQISLFILAGPQQKFNEIELESMKDFVNNGGSLMVLLAESGENAFDTNINFLLEEFGININSDSVVRQHYYKYFHPKEVVLNGCIVCENMNNELLKVIKKTGLSMMDEKFDIELVYPFGATLNVIAPSNTLITTSTIAYPFNRPVCGYFTNDNGGQILAMGSGHVFTDKYIVNEHNMFVWDYFVTLLVEKSIKFKAKDFNDVEVCWIFSRLKLPNQWFLFQIQDYTTIPDIIYLADQPKICLVESFDCDIPADFKKLFDMTLYSINNDRLHEVIDIYKKLEIDYEPLKIIKPQFELPLPSTQLAVFPPVFSDLPAPQLELFDLDEAFSSEKSQITQLTNKCFNHADKSMKKVDQKELEYFIRECGRILGISHDGAMPAKEVINSLSVKIANYKKIDKE